MSEFSDHVEMTEYSRVVLPCISQEDASEAARLLSSGEAKTVHRMECYTERVLKCVDKDTGILLGEVVLWRVHYGVPEHSDG